MDIGISSWRQDWIIDPDPLAAAQARHIPTGYGLTIKTIGAIAVPEGSRPYLALIYTDDSRGVIDAKYRELGFEGRRDWMAEMQKQAEQLWCQLGFDVDAAAPWPDHPPCQVTCWRSRWRQAGDPNRPDLIHASGFAVRHAHELAGNEGRPAWVATVPPEHAAAVAEAQASLGDVAIGRLRREAQILWMEEGFFNGSPTRLARPFGDAWRTLWTIREQEGEQWLVHASGLALTPVYGVVEDDGFEAWSLYTQSGDVMALDWDMRRRLGEKAWQRVHDQGWRLSVEKGYISSPGTLTGTAH